MRDEVKGGGRREVKGGRNGSGTGVSGFLQHLRVFLHNGGEQAIYVLVLSLVHLFAFSECFHHLREGKKGILVIKPQIT